MKEKNKLIMRCGDTEVVLEDDSVSITWKLKEIKEVMDKVKEMESERVFAENNLEG